MRALLSVVSLSQAWEKEQAEMLRQIEELIHRFCYFQAKYREYREQFIALRQRYLLVECAWCTRRIGWKPKTAAVPGDTSHGICASCAADLCRKMQAMKHSPDNDSEKAGNCDRGCVLPQLNKKGYGSLYF
jgi:hypothetical protein